MGEDTQGVHNEDFRKHTHRHELARFHCHCEEAGNYRGFSGDKSGHNHATCKGLSRVEKTTVFNFVPLTTKQFLREALHLFVGLAGPQILCAGLRGTQRSPLVLMDLNSAAQAAARMFSQ